MIADTYHKAWKAGATVSRPDGHTYILLKAGMEIPHMADVEYQDGDFVAFPAGKILHTALKYARSMCAGVVGSGYHFWAQVLKPAELSLEDEFDDTLNRINAELEEFRVKLREKRS